MALGRLQRLFRKRPSRQSLYLKLLRGLHLERGYLDWIEGWERYAPAEAAGALALPLTILVLGEPTAADRAYWSRLAEPRRLHAVFASAPALTADVVAQATQDDNADHVMFLHAGDRLADIAPARLQAALAAVPDAEVVYGDEDQVDPAGRRFAPWFKPDFGIDLFLSQSAFGRAVLFRKSALRRVPPPDAADLDTAVYQLVLRVIAESSRDPLHCPGVLVHVAGDPAATPKARVLYLKDAARRGVVEEFIARRPSLKGTRVDGPDAHGFLRLLHPAPEHPPLVSIVIPTRDRKDLLEQCIRGLDEGTRYRSFEIIIVDNDSREEATKAYFAALAARDNVRIVAAPGAFNYSRLINLGAAQARGELLMTLNNDIEAIAPDWLDELVSQVLRPDVGLVGCLLLYPDRSVQHAGVILGLGGVAGHIFAKTKGGDPGYAGRIAVAQDLSAVTGACHIMRRETFERLGGLDQVHLAVAYNDIDFCLRVREAGLRVIYTPFAPLLHKHSASRGSDIRSERLASFIWERDYMRTRWAARMWDDPWFNPNLSLSGKKGRLATPPRPRLYKG